MAAILLILTAMAASFDCLDIGKKAVAFCPTQSVRSFELRIFSFNAGSFFIFFFECFSFLTLGYFVEFQCIDPNVQFFSGWFFCAFVMFEAAFTGFDIEIIIITQWEHSGDGSFVLFL